MDNFNIKKFMVENKLTAMSRLVNEEQESGADETRWTRAAGGDAGEEDMITATMENFVGEDGDLEGAVDVIFDELKRIRKAYESHIDFLEMEVESLKNGDEFGGRR